MMTIDPSIQAEAERLETAPWCRDALFLVTAFGDGECAILVRGWKALCVRVVDMHFHDPEPEEREEVLSQLVDWEQWDNADGLPYHFSWSYEDGNISVTRVTDDEANIIAVAAALQAKQDEIAELRDELAKHGVTLATVSQDDTYDTPEHGWTCFHCGCHFAGTHRGWQAAGHHFGWTPNMQPACRIAEEEGGLPKRLRAYEDGQKRDEKAIDARDERIKVMEAALRSVQDLISMSRAVVGLHLNGDEAPWDELLRGGQFEAWLGDFSDAIPPEPAPDHSIMDEMLARTALNQPAPASTGEQKDGAE